MTHREATLMRNQFWIITILLHLSFRVLKHCLSMLFILQMRERKPREGKGLVWDNSQQHRQD